MQRKLKNIVTVEKVVEKPYEGCCLNLDNQSYVRVKIGIIYAPQESRTEIKELKRMYSEIQLNIEAAKVDEMTVLVLGDFNEDIIDIHSSL